jgi:hypothetical protein
VIDDCDLLRDFDVREFRTLQSLFPPKYSCTWSYRSNAMCFPRSTVDICPFPHFGRLAVNASLFPPKCSVPRVTDRVPHVLFQWMVQMNSDSPAFGSSCSTHSLFFRSNIPRNGRSSAMRPFQRMTGMTSGLRPSKILVPSHFDSPGVTSLWSAGSDDTCPFGLDGLRSASAPRLFGSFAMQTPLFSQIRSTSG